MEGKICNENMMDHQDNECQEKMLKQVQKYWRRRRHIWRRQRKKWQRQITYATVTWILQIEGQY